MMVGKYPKRLENLRVFEGWINFKFCVLRLILSANAKPRMVTAGQLVLDVRVWLLGGRWLGGCCGR